MHADIILSFPNIAFINTFIMDSELAAWSLPQMLLPWMSLQQMFLTWMSRIHTDVMPLELLQWILLQQKDMATKVSNMSLESQI